MHAMTDPLSIFAAAEQAPDQTAVLGADRQWTFAQAAQETERVLGRIRSRFPEARAGDLLAFSGVGSPAGLWTVYAALELGLGLVPLHTRWTDGERRDFIERIGALPELDPETLTRETLTGEAFSEPPHSLEERREKSAQSLQSLAPESLLAVLSTSGSTGKPKGVALSRRAFLASAQADAANLGRQAGDRTLLSLPLAHVGGLSIVTRNLISRLAIVLPTPGPRFEPKAFAHWIDRFDVTLLSLVPTMLQRLISAGVSPGRSLRAVLLGGAAASPALIEQARSLGWPILRTYGLTEACSQVATERLDESGFDGQAGAVGPMLPSVEARIVDGQLELRGPTLMTGYLPAADAGAEFTADGWFRTGDLAQFDPQGRLRILGRADDVIVSGGENVSPTEVEMALEQHSSVAMAAVFGVEDAEWGQTVQARVVLARGAEISGRELREYLRRRLAPFKIPQKIEVVPALAKTASGKINRRMLDKVRRDHALDKAFDPSCD